jgi:hypothetical protein
VWGKIKGSVMDKALKWFANIWIGMVVLLNVAGIIGHGLTAQSIGDVVNWVQQTYSPFNIWTHGLNLLLLSPAILIYFWREKRNAKGVE